MDIYTTIIEKDKLKIGNKFLGNSDLNISHPPENRYEAAILMAPEKGKRVLDIGCGNGTVLYNLKDRFDQLYGVELFEEQAQWARNTLNDCDNPVDIKVENVEQGLSHPDNHFDYVVMAAVIEHIFDVKKVISELVRVTKPNGILCITTPNISYIRRRLSLLFGRFPMTSNEKSLIEDNDLIDGGHIHYFTFSDLEFLLKDYGVTKKIGHGRLFNLVRVWPEMFASGICTCIVKDIIVT